MPLKVHKTENFFDSNFGICVISLLVFRVVLGLRGMKKKFELGPKIFDPILVFRKFNQLNAPGTTLCVDLGSKCQILFPLV